MISLIRPGFFQRINKDQGLQGTFTVLLPPSGAGLVTLGTEVLPPVPQLWPGLPPGPSHTACGQHSRWGPAVLPDLGGLFL